MASPISIGGLGSGLDTRAIIDALIGVERVPIQQLETRRKSEQDKINLINTFRGKVDALRTKASALSSLSGLMAFKVSQSEEGVATIGASGSAQAGTHTLVVEQTATTDRWAFNGVAAPDTDLATQDGETVSFDYGGQTYVATLSQSESSLNDVAAAINTAAAGKVSASVVNAGTAASPSWQLVLTAAETGADFRIQNVSSGIAALTIDSTPPTAAGVAQSANNISVGSNAIAVVDGLRVERTSNDFSDVLPGVSISVLDADPAKTVQFTVESDKAAIKGRIKEFVEAYNEVVKFVREQNKYDEEKGPGGALFGDNVLKTIQRAMNGALFGQSAAQVSADTSGFGTLRLVGVETQSDGSLKINDKVMDGKMDADLARFADLFVDTDGFSNGGAAVGTPGYYIDVTADSGLGDDLVRELDKVVKGYGDTAGSFYKGVFDARVETLNASIKSINDRIDQREQRLENTEEQLTRRFAALEKLMAQLQSQSAFLNR